MLGEIDWLYVDSIIREGRGYWLFKRVSMGQTVYYAFEASGSFGSDNDEEAREKFRKDMGEKG